MWNTLKNVLGLDKPKLVPPHSTTYDGGVAVELQSVSKSFIDKTGDMVLAVDEMKLKIYDNEFFTLLGPSGCGKTTLLRLIAGFDIPNSGRIVLYGDSVENVPAYRRHLNTVFQSYSLFPHLTIAQNIGFGLKMLGKDKSFIAKRVNSMLKMVKLSHLANRYPADLSGGQQQRIALARALACEPDVLLLDEPLSALDYKLRKQMQLELKRIQKETKITFIFVTHDQEEAMALSFTPSRGAT